MKHLSINLIWRCVWTVFMILAAGALTEWSLRRLPMWVSWALLIPGIIAYAWLTAQGEE